MKPEESFWKITVAPAPAVQDVFRTDTLAEMDVAIEDAIKEAQITARCCGWSAMASHITRRLEAVPLSPESNRRPKRRSLTWHR